MILLHFEILGGSVTFLVMSVDRLWQLVTEISKMLLLLLALLKCTSAGLSL